MRPTIEFDGETVTVRYKNLTAKMNCSTIYFCHFGCKILGTIENKKQGKVIPEQLKVEWDQKFGKRKAWADKDTKRKLAKSLVLALQQANLSGITLWDTMRKGCDYWRPGKLITETVGFMRESKTELEVFYAREDSFCPPVELLDTFRKTDMMFGDYAQGYAQYLESNSIVELASVYILMELAKGHLSAFYCIDPYVPDYANPSEMLKVDYKDRKWLELLRNEGCHRVVLAEEIVKFLISKGLNVELLEVDSTFQRVHKRSFSKNQGKYYNYF